MNGRKSKVIRRFARLHNPEGFPAPAMNMVGQRLNPQRQVKTVIMNALRTGFITLAQVKARPVSDGQPVK